jgi:hypothetical protein
MSKYKPLEEYLSKVTVTLTYSEIEEILGFKLPETAYNLDQWWENNTSQHTQANAWLNAGWKKESVNLGKDVTFIRSVKS